MSHTGRNNRSRLDDEEEEQQREQCRRGREVDDGVNNGAIVLGVAAAGLAAYFFGKAMTAAIKTLASTAKDCVTLIKEIKNDTNDFPVIGLDCQWVRDDYSRSPIALLQLVSHKGTVALIQLQKMRSNIPHELKILLSDRNIMKVGIDIVQDANFLREDFNLDVRGAVDVRFLARDLKHSNGGLQKLSKELLALDIGRDWQLMASDWEQDPLEQDQIKYAETAVKASFDIFMKLIGEKFWFPTIQFQRIRDYVEQWIDVRCANIQ